jgi:dihydroxy-acid dehydratase
MDDRKQNGASSGYLDFKCLPDGAVGKDGQPALNRYSSTLTRGMIPTLASKAYGPEHDYPGAKAMLFAAGVPDDEAMQSAPHLGIASVWWEGNPCK